MVCIPIYNEPERKDMAVIIAFFNPAQSIRMIQNVLTVRQCLIRANIPTYIGELAFDDQPFLFEFSDSVFHFRSDSYMFYKENIMKAVESRIPARYTKIVQLDADILFEDPDWYRRVSETLEKHVAIQPYSNAAQLQFNFQYTQQNVFPSCAMRDGMHPGYAWAFQRAWWKSADLFDQAVIGGGDSMIGYQCGASIRKMAITPFYSCCFPENIISKKSESTGVCDLTIYHLPHGTIANRQYTSRYETIKKILQTHKLHAISDTIERRDDGILVWKDQYKKSMNDILKTYFINRKDDEI